MFPDVPRNHWAYDAVKSLKDKGILQGYPSEPTRQGKRTAFQSGGDTETASQVFEDIPAGHWAYANLRQLHKKGLIEIIRPAHQIDTNLRLTRYECAVIIMRAFDRSGNSSAGKRFASLPETNRVRLLELVDEFRAELRELNAKAADYEKLLLIGRR